MIAVRKAQARGHANHGWLDSYHTFSFSNYYDPQHMGFRHLRVINEDRVQPGNGFATHSHRDMEIISYVLEGAIEHKDSMGNVATIRPGEVQIMSAGTGVTHSEYNPSSSESGHFLQIWILPAEKGIKPRYEQKNFSAEEKQGKLRLVVAPDGRDGAVTINQDALIYASLLAAGEQVVHSIPAGRHVWLQVVKGEIAVNDMPLLPSDGAAISDESKLVIDAKTDAEFLLFDLA